MIDYSSILSRYSPAKEERERIDRIVRTISDYVIKYCDKQSVEADPIVVGSVAKGTNLRDGDIDVFIRFSKSYEKHEMERIGMDIGHKVLKNGEEKYAEHPYVTGFMDGIKIDIVPCYRISKEEKKVSSVDRTPLHTEFIRSNLKANQIDEVLLLKVFMKSIGVYGSEVKTSGFSGYICELLTINYGSFDSVLRMFSGLSGRLVLPDTEQMRRKFGGPVVIVDPVDDDRNAAAAVIIDNLSKVKVAAKEFLRAPSDEFFIVEREWPHPEYVDRGTSIRVFSLPRPEVTDDVVYTQALRFKNILWSILERGGFLPVSWEINIEETVDVLIECERDRIPLLNVHRGPPVDTKNIRDFIEKWEGKDVLRGPYIKGDRLYVDLRNEFLELEETIKRDIVSFNIGMHLNRFRDKMKITDPSIEKKRMKVLDRFYSKTLFW